jgi:hypothetical protein
MNTGSEKVETMRKLEKGIRSVGWLAMPMALLIGGCDFDVTNPGPVQDEFLDDPDAFVAVVNGMGRALSDGMNYVAFHGALVTRELFPTGGTGQFGISVKNGDGILDRSEQGAPWNNTQGSRWSAEDGLRRFGEVMSSTEFASSEHVAMAYLWAGYANRTLGENMCEAVIDVGPAQPREVFLTRAQEHFSNAIEVGSASGEPEIVTAARAGRAAVRVQLGDWSGAVTDAGSVPTDFEFNLGYYDIGDRDQYNRIAHASGNDPYKTHTVWGTVYQDYFTESEDARVSWVDTGLPGDGGVEGLGPVPFLKQLKYPTRAADITLSSGREMRLIEAEADLVGGDWEAAMTTINQLRTDAGVGTRTATNSEEAWTFLKRERGIELWMEGRRLGDFYRWNANGTPGALDPLETVGGDSYLKQQDLCFPIPDSEIETNPNLSK